MKGNGQADDRFVEDEERTEEEKEELEDETERGDDDGVEYGADDRDN